MYVPEWAYDKIISTVILHWNASSGVQGDAAPSMATSSPLWMTKLPVEIFSFQGIVLNALSNISVSVSGTHNRGS
jgi:hypothetical protein